jgi:monoamine oxidase
MQGQTADVVVIGAGAAGLTAARILSAAGLQVTILEARDRIGGRIYTVPDAFVPAPVELGAEFVHGRPPQIWNIQKTGALLACDVKGDHWFSQEGSLIRANDRLAGLDAVFERMAGAPEQSFQEFIEHCDCDAEVKAWATGYVEGFNAARKERISIRSLVEDARASEAIGGERAFRILNGYDRVAHWLRAGLDPGARLHLSTVVDSIRWSRGKVEVQAHAEATRPAAAAGPFAAQCAVITVPIGVLKAPEGAAGAIRFVPEPHGWRDSLARLEMGQAFRITLRFRERFWEEPEKRADLSFLFSYDPWMPTWWTALPLRAPIITGWAAGPLAENYMGRAGHFVAARALDTLARLLEKDRSGVEALLEAWYVHDWHSDPFARGAYSYVAVGGMEARRKMAAPVEDTLYLASEATCTEGHSGTVHGAMATGERAAREILRKFQVAGRP